MLSYATQTHGRFASYWKSTPGSFASYSEAYPAALASVMTAAVARVGLALDDVVAVLPHSVNAVSWHRLCLQIGFPAERLVLDNLAVTGHSFCADPFINYRTAIDDGRIGPGDTYLMVAAGLSGTFSAMAFRR